MLSLSLEEFEIGSADQTRATPEMVPYASVEKDRIAAYEQGYQAGWDDAAKSQSEDQLRIGAEFARTLQELSFTFHEARSHVIQSMEPLLSDLIATVLPALVSETLGEKILEELRPMLMDGADSPVELVVSPASRPALERHMNDFKSVAIRLTEEPSLADGQAYLRLGKSERQIDLSGALDRISEAVRALYAINERTLKHA